VCDRAPALAVQCRAFSTGAAPSAVGINKQIAGLRRVEAVVELCHRRSSELDAINIATALHRLARCPDRAAGVRLAPSILALLAPSPSQFGAQALANTAWSLATLHYSDAPCLDAIASAAITRIGECRA